MCRKYNLFHSETFINSLKKEPKWQSQLLWDRRINEFSELFRKVFDNHARLKKDYVIPNYKIFISNESSETIMVKNRLTDCFPKTKVMKIDNYFANFEIWNLRASLLRKIKTNHFTKLHEKQVTDKIYFLTR